MESKLLPCIEIFFSWVPLYNLSCAPLVRFVSDREEEEHSAEPAEPLPDGCGGKAASSHASLMEKWDPLSPVSQSIHSYRFSTRNTFIVFCHFL